MARGVASTEPRRDRSTPGRRGGQGERTLGASGTLTSRELYFELVPKTP